MAHYNFGESMGYSVKATYKKYDCGIHDLTYKGFRPGCPLCEADRDVTQMREAIRVLSSQVEHLQEENSRLKVQVDMVASIRDAIPQLNETDREFLKLTLYMHRDEKSVNIRPTRGGTKGEIVGFLRMSRRDEPVGHLCSSVGGLAIADYLGEAINTYGQVKAMEIMTRALSSVLPGSLR